MSHHKILVSTLQHNLFQVDIVQKIVCLDEEAYVDFVKRLYAPKGKETASFDEVRRLSMAPRQRTLVTTQTPTLRSAQMWLPPESAVRKMAKLVCLQIKYLLTAGFSVSKLPDFEEGSCFIQSEGNTDYNFGTEIHATVQQLVEFVGQTKRKMLSTPQKGKNKKRRPILTSTPKKNNDN